MGSQDETSSLFEMREEGLPPLEATQSIRNELLLDGTPSLNLAGFATTFMGKEAEELMLENLAKNISHLEAYPASNMLENRCINIIARLFHAPLSTPESEAVGLSTLGSSEAVFVSVFAAKRRWQNARKIAGKSFQKPNMVLHSNVHVCWKKAALYLDIEERYCFAKENQYMLDPYEAVSLVDENSILVCSILGSTYTGEYDDIQALNDLLHKKNIEEGLDVNIHVDAASGGFVVPFVQPALNWDFRLPLVCSINVSGHKFGLTYAAVGWAIWRSRVYLPQELIFSFNYCGSPQTSFTINFSKSAANVIGQYYQLISLGRSGYRSIMNSLTKQSDFLSSAIMAISNGQKFVLLSKTAGKGLPLVAWRLKNQVSYDYDEYAVARHLRLKGWIVPAYTMDIQGRQVKLLRVIVRTEFTRERCSSFIRDLNATMEYLDSTSEPPSMLSHPSV